MSKKRTLDSILDPRIPRESIDIFRHLERELSSNPDFELLEDVSLDCLKRDSLGFLSPSQDLKQRSVLDKENVPMDTFSMDNKAAAKQKFNTISTSTFTPTKPKRTLQSLFNEAMETGKESPKRTKLADITNSPSKTSSPRSPFKKPATVSSLSSFSSVPSATSSMSSIPSFSIPSKPFTLTTSNPLGYGNLNSTLEKQLMAMSSNPFATLTETETSIDSLKKKLMQLKQTTQDASSLLNSTATTSRSTSENALFATLGAPSYKPSVSSFSSTSSLTSSFYNFNPPTKTTPSKTSNLSVKPLTPKASQPTTPSKASASKPITPSKPSTPSSFSVLTPSKPTTPSKNTPMKPTTPTSKPITPKKSTPSKTLSLTPSKIPKPTTPSKNKSCPNTPPRTSVESSVPSFIPKPKVSLPADLSAVSSSKPPLPQPGASKPANKFGFAGRSASLSLGAPASKLTATKIQKANPSNS